MASTTINQTIETKKKSELDKNKEIKNTNHAVQKDKSKSGSRSENQVDKKGEDSFPASDPPGGY